MKIFYFTGLLPESRRRSAQELRLNANPQTIPIAIRFGDGMAAAEEESLKWRKRKMKENYLTRPQIALVLIGHIFEELDVHDIEELVTKAATAADPKTTTPASNEFGRVLQHVFQNGFSDEPKG